MDIKQLQSIFPTNHQLDEWLPIFETYFEKYEINTPERQAAFTAQAGHESADLRILEENLYYSEQALLKVFPYYFNQDNVKDYAMNPVRIANRVYANRMGNGVENSGDGWRYRGEGIFQLTGHDNYAAFSKWLYGDTRLLQNSDYLLTKEGALLSALWFWQVNGFNKYADEMDNISISKLLNCGTVNIDESKVNGLEDRIQRFLNAHNILTN